MEQHIARLSLNPEPTRYEVGQTTVI